MGIFKQTAYESGKDKKVIRDAMVYNIWLAGLGAYAKSADEVNQLSDKGKSLFDELVERGHAVESKTKERVHTARNQTSVAIEERVHQMVQKFIGIDNERLNRVDNKIDQLTASIESLLERQQTAKPEQAKAIAKPTTAKAPAAQGKKSGVARRKSAKTTETAVKKDTAVKKEVVSEKPRMAEPVKNETAAKPVAEKMEVKPASEKA
ncbi:phasin-related domain-containing protein [Photobacterium sp.]|uniref:phasin-related domain-containing protein n=1 Tax=Photobacterium sp. TaxID=660 RepID=UPI00299D7253|nr:phasin family protein [Photobacterium sp.]MDX1301797.1 phasin family protein [Photobacterium sp.]